MSELKSEYFNFYVESIPDVQSGQIKTVALAACEKSDIIKYFQFLKENNLGLKPFGNEQIEIVIPRVFQIFDFAYSEIKSEKNVKEFHKNEVRKSYKLAKNYLRTFLSLGKEVTGSFGIKLEDYLLDSNPEVFIPTDVTTTTTVTTINELEDKKQEELKSNTNSGKEKKATAVFQIVPKEFSKGIIDNSVEPAFDVEKIAEVFANHLKCLNKENGQMVGVFGQWGRGKSYFIDKVLEQFKSDKVPPFVHIKFQAWKYQNAPSVWAYLFETFIDEYLNVKWHVKICRLFKLSLARNGHWKTWILPIIGLLIAVLAVMVTPQLKEASNNQFVIKIVGYASILAITFDNILSVFKNFAKPATTIFNSISKVPSFKNVLGVQSEIQKELKDLIETWSRIIGKKRILLFVDDLDRCSDYQIIEIVDSLRVILDDELITKHVLILVALDEAKLKKAIKNKYEKLFDIYEMPEVVDEYMDKLFISAIKLFPISSDERIEFVKKLLVQINLEGNPANNSKKGAESTLSSKVKQKTEISAKQNAGSEQTPSLSSEEISGSATLVDNLDPIEINLLEEKIRLARKVLTPRQIRILIYRYLLARNLWLIFFKGERFENGDAITEIMRFSEYNELDPKAETQVFQGLSKIARMVVAY